MWRVARALQILELLAAEPQGARVTDLATTLGLNKAIPHRILAELRDLGYVLQDPATERYRATFKLGSLGLRQLETAGLSRWARDELEELAATTKELVRLGVVSGNVLRFVAKARGAANGELSIDSALTRNSVRLGSASGRAWLSTLPEDEALALLSTRGLDAPADTTPLDLRSLVEEIARAKQVGYAVIHGDMEIGINAIAAPIVPPGSPGGRAVGTVSIAGPSVRLTPGVLDSFVPALRATVERLGCQWSVYDYLKAISGPLGGQ